MTPTLGQVLLAATVPALFVLGLLWLVMRKWDREEQQLQSAQDPDQRWEISVQLPESKALPAHVYIDAEEGDART